METTDKKPLLDRPIPTTLIGFGITILVIFVAAWAAGKGWNASSSAPAK